jgi:Rubredoxin metal binding domain
VLPSKVRTVLSCRDCGQQLARWAGRCPGCGAWGTIEGSGGGSATLHVPLETLAHEDADERRVSTGLPGIVRVLGGGLAPSTVPLLAGEPGISKVYLGARRHEHGGRLASRGIQSVGDRLLEGEEAVIHVMGWAIGHSGIGVRVPTEISLRKLRSLSVALERKRHPADALMDEMSGSTMAASISVPTAAAEDRIRAAAPCD